MYRKFQNRINEVTQKADPHAEIILFGSRARGDNRKNSDWDVLILLEVPIYEEVKKEIRDALFELELEYDQAVSSVIFNKKDWLDMSITPLYQNIEHEGVPL